MLKPLIKNIKKQGVIGFDIETYDENKKFLLCSLFFSENEYYVFYSEKEVIGFILSHAEKFRDKIIFAHNLGFDFLGVFFSSKLLPDFEIILRDSGFILAQSYIFKNKFYKKIPNRHDEDYVKIVFYDTFNFVKYHLESMGKIINIPKMKTPIFLGQFPKDDKEWAEIKEYNVNDSRVVKNFADFLQDTFNNTLNCAMKSTIAATAMDNFKRNYLDDSYTTPKISQLPHFYLSLKGGRTETFQRGYIAEKIKVYDVNSLYPYVMDKYLYPNPNTQHYRASITRSEISEFDGITNVKMSYNDDMLPYLPYRTPNKLIFPKGIFRGWYSNFEIRKAVENNYRIEKIYNGYYFTKNVNFFGNFVKDLYKLRLKFKSEKSPLEVPIKITMNSLYGKFAQDIFEKYELVHYKELDYEEWLFLIRNQIGKSDFYRRKKDFTANNKPNFIIPIISAYVTSYARDELFNRIKNIHKDVIACDTDSIFTIRNLPVSDKLGGLKIEETFKELYAVKPKFYGGVTDEDKPICKIKGIPSLEQDLDIFREILKNPVKSYYKFLKFREALLQSLIPNTRVLLEKKFDLEDNKRDWLGKKFSMSDFAESIPLTV
jgi:hypothetical protein